MQSVWLNGRSKVKKSANPSVDSILFRYKGSYTSLIHRIRKIRIIQQIPGRCLSDRIPNSFRCYRAYLGCGYSVGILRILGMGYGGFIHITFAGSMILCLGAAALGLSLFSAEALPAAPAHP